MPVSNSWRKALDEQLGLWRWYQTRHGLSYLAESYADTLAGLPEGSGAVDLCRALYANEAGDKLLACDPIYVSADMCELIEAASEGFQPEPLLPTDLLTPIGFVYLDQPWRVLDRFDEPVTIDAFSWTPLVSAGDGEVMGETRPLSPEEILKRWEPGQKYVGGIGLTLYSRTPGGRLIPFHVTPWYFGMSFDGNEVDIHGRDTGAAWWWRLLQTAFRIAMQPITARHSQVLHRAQRREWERLRGGAVRDPEVLVVRLRRETGEREEGNGGSVLTKRHLVQGHWRNQWYPSANAHRQIWIGTYIKGPEGAPLLLHPKRAFTLTR